MKKRLLFAALASLLICSTAFAQNPQGLAQAGDPSAARPGLLAKIAIDQRIGHDLPADLPFVDESGRAVKLGDYFGKRAVVLASVYYECPMLFSQVLSGLVSSLATMNLQAGRDFDVVAVSFNPKEGPGLAAEKKAAYVHRYGRPDTASGWHFLTGTQDAISRLTEAVGFRY